MTKPAGSPITPFSFLDTAGAALHLGVPTHIFLRQARLHSTKPAARMGHYHLYLLDDIEKLRAGMGEIRYHNKSDRMILRIGRARRYAEMYKSLTLEEIAAKEGITRERVRQLIAEIGVTAIDGYTRKRALSKSAACAVERVVQREAKCKRMYGCSWEDYKNLTGSNRLLAANSKLSKLFIFHRNNARQLNREWSITLPEYAKIVTPHINDVGLKRNSMVFTRKDSTLPFTFDNCHVVTLGQSSRDARGFEKARKRIVEQAVALYAAGMSTKQIGVKLNRCEGSITKYLAINKNQQETKA